jgi:leucyl-tRNA synthetase
LPVVLPEDCVPDGSGNPLNKREDFLKCTCPKCGKPARRETDTMDTFVDSSWYFMRYTSPGANAMVDERNDYWMPMDQYIGGIEHAILHLLYARFWIKVMRDLGLVKFDEPFSNLLTQGMVLNDTYYIDEPNGRKTWVNPDDVLVETDDKGRPVSAKHKTSGKAVNIGGVEKMAKSKNNGIDPQSLIDQYGADTARLFTMFAAPPEQQLEWSSSGVEGASRFLRRLWSYGSAHAAMVQSAKHELPATLSEADTALRLEVHGVLKQANFDYQRKQYNTVVSATMKMFNALEQAKTVSPEVRRETLGILLRVLYPVVPHITFTLWNAAGYVQQWGDLLDAPWPEVDESALVQNEITLMIQVNGKLRGQVLVPTDADKASIEALALASEAAIKAMNGAPAKKVIIVPGRLVNIVI